MPGEVMELAETLDRRGRGTLDFLDYCVRSVQLEPLFVFLVQEYRSNPTIPKAVALFHTFCAPAAPAKIGVPTDDAQLQSAMRPITVSWTRMQAALVFGPGNAAPPMAPAASLFDGLAETILCTGIFTKLKRRYRTDLGNVPRVNRAQRDFIEKIWQPIIRPHLVAAGFWRIDEVG